MNLKIILNVILGVTMLSQIIRVLIAPVLHNKKLKKNNLNKSARIDWEMMQSIKNAFLIMLVAFIIQVIINFIF